jgi:hypothetical protein
MKVTRIYTGDDGESYFEDVEIPLERISPGGRLSESVAVRSLIFRETDGDYNLDFHCAPRRQYVVNLTGSVEIETGPGDKRLLGPGSILLAEDTTGKGHISRAVGHEERQSLFIALDES